MYRQWLYQGALIAGLLSSCLSQPLLAQNSIIQRNSSSATATGNNNYASSQVRQSASQTGSGNPLQPQTIEQYGASSATATGENNVVITDIYQSSHQQGSSSNQNIQRATVNGTARGRNNRIFSHTRQYNFQGRY